MPRLPNDPRTDAGSSRCGHNFTIDLCPYQHCAAREIFTLARLIWNELNQGREINGTTLLQAGNGDTFNLAQVLEALGKKAKGETLKVLNAD